ncbi:putative reverse transcriptase domain-containing protein, partial [Tanacetum coccineum]
MLRAFPMSLTGAASRWLRNKPTGSITTWDGLKTIFLNKYCPPARIAKKMEKINNFQQEPDENLYQAYERFKELLMKCPQHYLTEMQETATDAKLDANNAKDPITPKIAHSKKKGKPLKKLTTRNLVDLFKERGYRAAASGFYQRNNVNPSYQEQRKSIEDTLSKFISESAKRHEENSNLIKEIRASTDAAIRNQRSLIKTLEIQIGQMSNVLQERGFGSLPSSTEANLRDQVKSISTTIEDDSYPIRRIRSSQYTVSTGQNLTLMYETRQTKIPFPSHLNGYYCEVKKGSYGQQFSEAYSKALHINNSIPRKEKDPGSFTLPCFINNVCF